MKFKVILVLVIIFSYASIIYAYPTYQRINLKPVAIECDADIALAGRDIYPEEGLGPTIRPGITSAADVDIHQVTIHQTVVLYGPGRTSGNMVEYVPTNPSYAKRTDLLDTHYQVDVSLIPVKSVPAEGFILIKNDNDLWYKIWFIQGLGVKLLYNKNGVPVNKLYAFDIQPRHTYRVNIDDVSERLSIRIVELEEDSNTQVATIDKLPTTSNNKLWRMFVGTGGVPATFRNEAITVFAE